MAESDDRRKLQSDWFQFAEGDWISAKLLSNADAPANSIGLLIQQGIEKFLKGYLLGNGWELLKTHNIEFLLGQAAQFDERFEQFSDYGKAVTALYAEDRYPFINRQDVPMERLREMIETGERVIALLKGENAE